jgi:hypothetical protein
MMPESVRAFWKGSEKADMGEVDCGGWDAGRLLGSLEAFRIKDEDSKTDIGTEVICSGGWCGFGGDVPTVE